MANDVSHGAPRSTIEPAYAHRLERLSARGGVLRRLIDPQRPYRWNLRRLHPGFVLDIGCGIGRNLAHLDGNGVGVDHNSDCVAACVARGLVAFTPAEFTSSAAVDGRFDSMLFAHVLEHMTEDDAAALVADHLRFVRTGGRIIVITPQARGQRSDPTHVALVDESAIRRLAARLNLQVVSIRSFPLPFAFGPVFTHNETVSVLRRPEP
ncbi:MAG: class I SAM-dependent methyltransferase [Ilumatobacteraceae bacterium]